MSFPHPPSSSSSILSDACWQGREDEYAAVAWEMVGLDRLWHVVLDAADEDVSLAASRRLEGLFQYYGTESVRPKAIRLREQHIARCVRQLQLTTEEDAVHG